MKLINLPPLGLLEGGQFVTLSLIQSLPGALFIYNQPPNYGLEILSMVYVVTASAVVANRQARLTLNYGANQLSEALASNAYTAAQTVVVSFVQQGVNASVAGSLQVVGIGRLYLPPEGRLFLTAAQADAGDKYNFIQLSGIAYPLS
jgi:hypothetical protein